MARVDLINVCKTLKDGGGQQFDDGGMNRRSEVSAP